ncbi:MAG: OpgC domain-containing protein [Actinomycetota bacterium]|nr:OpgC domain-containing protein [Actinomycetota bacterium]
MTDLRPRPPLPRRETQQTLLWTLATLAGLQVLAAVLLVTLVPGDGRGDGGTVLTGATARYATAAAGLVALVLLLAGLTGAGGRWRYDVPGRRDLRVDMLRGLAVVFVVLNHLQLESLWELLSQELIGPVSGAELFVALSGAVLGLVYRPRFETSPLTTAASPLLKRAWKLYYTSLAVVVVVYLMSVGPRVEGEVVTTFTDQGTGAAGAAAAGTVYDLYPNIHGFAAYPVPGFVIESLLLLQEGPWQFNVMGLYVVLLLAAPLLLALLRRRLWPVVLGVSWVLYGVNEVARVQLLPSQFEDSFPLLSWQVLFVTGLVAGWHRQRLLDAAGTAAGRAVVTLAVVAYCGTLFFSWNNPFLSNAYDARLALIPDATFNAVYRGWFERTFVEPGRLVSVVLVLVALFALLTAFWKPLAAAAGWFLIPLGQATLYVFIMHVFLALALANIPALDETDVVQGTVAHTVVLALLWVMVKRRFLFWLVPR